MNTACWIVVALLAAAAPGPREARVGVEWIPLARGPATVSVASFTPKKSGASASVTVYGFMLSADADCRRESNDRVPQPDAKGKWGPYQVPRDRTLCVTTSGGAGGVLRYSVQ